MTDYRFVMGLLLQGYAYRQIEAMAGCSHRAIARARRVLDEEGFTTREQVDGLSLEDIGRLFTDGRTRVWSRSSSRSISSGSSQPGWGGTSRR